MKNILVWMLLMAIAGILITMMLISLAPYIAAIAVLWIVFKSNSKPEPGTNMINIGGSARKS